jgi:hypothetical protein
MWQCRSRDGVVRARRPHRTTRGVGAARAPPSANRLQPLAHFHRNNTYIFTRTVQPTHPNNTKNSPKQQHQELTQTTPELTQTIPRTHQNNNTKNSPKQHQNSPKQFQEFTQTIQRTLSNPKHRCYRVKDRAAPYICAGE